LRVENPTAVIAEDDFLDFDALAIEHIRLERRVPELARQLERAVHRAGAFPSDFGRHEVRKLKRERQAILDRLAEISGLMLLVPLRRAR
jgi:hypothetical protein